MSVRPRNTRLHVLSAATALALGLVTAPAFAGQVHVSGLQTSQQGSNRFIVKFRKGSPERADVARVRNRLAAVHPMVGGQPVNLAHVRRLAVGADVLRADRKLDRAGTEALMRMIAADPSVEYVEIDRLNKAVLSPNDTNYATQWGFNGTYGIKAPQAWDMATGTGSVVAVLDTGITNHSELNANVLPGYDFIVDVTTANDGDGRDSDPSDPGDWVAANQCGGTHAAQNSSWHGTHVAGTIAAATNNAAGVAGAAFNAKVVPVRVLGTCGGYDSDIADAIVWASGGTVAGVPANANPAEVINLSLGGTGDCGATMQTAINGAVGRGTTLAIAAGNGNSPTGGFSPANCANVIAVGSITSAGLRSSFSNYGSDVDIAAPGSAILSTLNAGTTTPGAESYATYNGTSMATPHVAGVIALLQSLATTPRTPAEVEALIKANVTAFPSTPSQPIGPGILNAKAVLDAANSVVPAPSFTTLVKGVPATNQASPAGYLRYKMVVPAGATNLSFTLSGGTGDADIYVRFGSEPSGGTYDCRPWLTGNAEVCNFPTPSAGTYYVSLDPYAAFTGVTLVGDYTLAGPQTYTNDTDVAIADKATVESPITISGRSGNGAAKTPVSVNIVHTFKGDLKVELVAPDGSAYLLHNRTGGSADNVVQTYTVNLSGEALNGAWKLRVNDNAIGDTGYINSWSITF